MKRFLFLLVLVLSLPLVHAYSLSYDANGNLITGDGFYRIYDASNHLVEVYLGDSPSIASLVQNYTWHAMEERVAVKYTYNNGTLNETVYYPSEKWTRVVNSSGSFDFFYIYQNGELIAMQDFNGKKFFYHNDHKGSPQMITDEQGNVVEMSFY